MLQFSLGSHEIGMRMEVLSMARAHWKADGTVAKWRPGIGHNSNHAAPDELEA